MPASDTPLTYSGPEPADLLVPVLVAAITGGRRLLGEPRLLHQLLLRVRRTAGVRTGGEPRRPDELRIPGLAPALEGELRRRARAHGVSYGAYIVTVLGQLARLPASIDAAPGGAAEPPGRGQPPDLHLVIGTGPASPTSRT